MQHIDGVLELCHVEDAIFTLRMDSNLKDSGADDWNRLPIAGRKSCLNQAQLIADCSSKSRRTHRWDPQNPPFVLKTKLGELLELRRAKSEGGCPARDPDKITLKLIQKIAIAR